MRQKLFIFFLALVASVGTMFAESGTCGDNLTWNYTNGVLTISGSGKMYDYGCNSSPWYNLRTRITSLSINNRVTSIGSGAFCGCTVLTSVTIPNSVTSISDNAFSGCTGLTSVSIPSSVNEIGQRAFFNCYVLTSVNIPNGVTRIEPETFIDCYALTSITIPNNVKSIGDWAFRNCTGLTSVSIPNSVTKIGDYAFLDCSKLSSVTIGENVTSIGKCAFAQCALTSITIPNSVTSMGEEVFASCTQLTSAILPNSITSIVNRTFMHCIKLTSITIPSSITSIGSEAFYNCEGLTSIEIPSSVTKIGSYAFYNCTGLTSVSIPNSVTSIGYSAFYNVFHLVYNGTATGSPWGAKFVNKYMDGSVLYSDQTRTTVLACVTSATGGIVIPNSVTSISDNAFSDCTKLSSVTIGENVTTIGEKAFYSCRKLEEIICNAVNPPNLMGDNVFFNVSKYIPLYVPARSVGHYETAEGWSDFKQIKPIPVIEYADEINTSEVNVAVNEDNSVTIEWPAVEGAESYEISIMENYETVQQIEFDKNGRLITKHLAMPSRHVNRHAKTATQSPQGWRYTIEGLKPNTEYFYSVYAWTKDYAIIYSKYNTFTTSEIVTSIEDVELNVMSRKKITNGQILILRGDKTFTLQGQEVR